MSGYDWALTRTFFDFVGPLVSGPRGGRLTVDEIKAHDGRQFFRMKDGDGHVYCLGVLVDHTGNASGFEPLYDYGQPALGCTSIEYRNDRGEWAEL